METNRQKKIAGVIQKDLVDILQSAARDGMKGVVISVTKVNVTSDLGQAKAYLSIFPSDKKDEILEGIKGAKEITAIEPNKVVVTLLKNAYASLTDSLFYHNKVQIQVLESRTYLNQTNKKFDVIQLPMQGS